MFQFLRIALDKPRGEERKVLVLYLRWKAEEAIRRLAPAPLRTAMTRPAVAFRVVDEVVEGELAAGSDVSACDDIDSIATEAQVDVGVAHG